MQNSPTKYDLPAECRPIAFRILLDLARRVQRDNPNATQTERDAAFSQRLRILIGQMYGQQTTAQLSAALHFPQR